MGYITNQQSNTGLYIGTTQAWDISVIYQTDVNSPEFKELIVKLATTMNNIATALNLKTSGLYQNQEFQTGQLLFPSSLTANDQLNQRPLFRMVVNFGALPNTSSTSVAHNIVVNAEFTFIKIYGASFDPVGLTAIPIPYVSATPVYLELTSTDVVITTTSNMSNYTDTIIVIEYVKS